MPRGDATKSNKDLDVWLLAMSLAENRHRATKDFPREETNGMTAQIWRASASIPANIAEGYGRDQTGGFMQFLRIAQGSTRCESISKMLRSLIRKILTTHNSPLTISPK